MIYVITWGDLPPESWGFIEFCCYLRPKDLALTDLIAQTGVKKYDSSSKIWVIEVFQGKSSPETDYVFPSNMGVNPLDP